MLDDSIDAKPSNPKKTPAWKEIVARYQHASTRRAVWQLINTIGPYLGLWLLMYFCLGVSYWLVMPLALLAGAFMVRAFIIFHDCGHGSFFKSKRANAIVGVLTGVLTLTPYYQWRWEHAVHHSSSGDLDRRGTGDVWTLTVEEYLQSSRWKKFAYRLARNPFVLFVLAPLALFLFLNRVPNRRAPRRERRRRRTVRRSSSVVSARTRSAGGSSPYCGAPPASVSRVPRVGKYEATNGELRRSLRKPRV